VPSGGGVWWAMGCEQCTIAGVQWVLLEREILEEI
jgi:hypothetical protein